MTQYFIGIGSNDQADESCRLMIAALRNQFDDVQVSKLVRTPAHGIEAPDYLNGVACFDSSMTAEALNLWCKALELRLGRDRRQALCRADLDILLVVDNNDQIQPDSVDEVYFRPLINELLEDIRETEF